MAGWGWLTNPRRAAYNRVYSRTTKGCAVLIAVGLILTAIATAGLLRVA